MSAKNHSSDMEHAIDSNLAQKQLKFTERYYIVISHYLL